MKLLKSISLLGVSLFASTMVLAHAHLAASTPAQNSVVTEAPNAIELSFTEEVQLLKFAIAGSDGQAVATEFKPGVDAQKIFSVPLPMLEHDSYTVSWTILGDDGHRVEDNLSFTVDANASESAGKSVETHSEHSH